MQLFYAPTISQDSDSYVFPKEESKHIIKVLRKKIDDILHITNGKGWLFKVKITLATPNKCIADIQEAEYHEPTDLKIHLAVAPTKMNDRYEWFLEKATEIGITEITPIFCDHSERKNIKKERFEKIIQSAAKQSLQFHFPILNDALSVKEFLAKSFDGETYIAHCENQEKASLKSRVSKATNSNFLVLIGPEGDFSTNEIENATRKNFLPISLGETRLRTETAAIVAVHSIVYSKQS